VIENTILPGNSLGTLKTLPDSSVDCCVTSPPYYGLRDYGAGKWIGGDPECNHFRDSKIVANATFASDTIPKGDSIFKEICKKCGAKREDLQIGLEKTPEEYIEKLVQVFREVRRILRDDGTLWVNIGDSYAGSRKGGNCKPKDLIGIPWMLAFALRADSWYLRQDIIWNKPNPLPESVTDRCTKAHEYIFLLSKSRNYYFNNIAIAEPAKSTDIKKFTDNGKDKQRGHSRRHAGFNGIYAEKLAAEGVPSTRNRRDVWMVATRPYSDAHLAVFPEKLILPCILAGCKEGGTVLDPFMGSGTTAVVAVKNFRKYIGCEINQEYIKIAEKRIANEKGLFNNMQVQEECNVPF